MGGGKGALVIVVLTLTFPRSDNGTLLSLLLSLPSQLTLLGAFRLRRPVEAGFALALLLALPSWSGEKMPPKPLPGEGDGMPALLPFIIALALLCASFPPLYRNRMGDGDDTPPCCLCGVRPVESRNDCSLGF